MKRLVLLALALTVLGAGEKAPLPSFSEPSFSPDGSEIAFASGGDLWSVPASGGEARLLVSHPAQESRPLFSPDGKRLAFISTRTGNGDVYLLHLETGDVKRLTFDDAFEQLDGWSRDGRYLYFSSTAHDVAGMNDVFRVSVDGGTPLEVAADRYANEYFAAPAPDRDTLLITARAIAASQWWRNGHSHIDEAEIWRVREGSPPTYEALTEGGAKELWPLWSPDASRFYYVSDRSGAENLWTRDAHGAGRPLTSFTSGRVLWPSISRDGRAIVFERNFAIWRLSTGSGEPREVPIRLRGAAAGQTVEHLKLTSDFSELALSPDGKKIALVARGEIFAASAKDGGDAQRVTQTAAPESQVTWSPDSRKLVYVSARGLSPSLFAYDFGTNKETLLGRGYSPRLSPDGKELAFIRDGAEIRVLKLDSKEDRFLARGTFEKPPLADRGLAWSPDGKWIAFLTPQATRWFQNVHVIAAAGGESRQVSFLANTFGDSITWSPDGTYLLFGTGQRTENGQVARVDLIARTPRFREDQFRDLFEEPQKPAQAANEPEPKRTGPVTVVFEDIRKRASLVPIGLDVESQALSPDGKWLLLGATAAGQQNLYLYSLDELSKDPPVARQLTSTAGRKSSAQFSPDSKEVFFLEDGRVQVAPVDGRPRSVAVTCELDVDFSTEKLEVFEQAWSYLRDHFFDPSFNGRDWSEVRSELEPRVAAARTPGELRRLVNLMVGELNASHLGISAPARQSVTATGRLGLRFDRLEFERSGRLKTTEVVALAPAAVAGVKTGEYLHSVDGIPVDARFNLDAALENKIGKRVVLTLGDDRREVVLKPVNASTEKALLYRQWVEEKRAYVDRASRGRLGYVHMLNMSADALAQLYLDLDSENQSRDGVVVDVRNNSGGFVNVYAIDVLARRGYLGMTLRGRETAPARTVLGQRALDAPSILVTNQHSLSDAEDFTEGYRALKLGKVVGEPTAGWIIYTWNENLLDGSTLRLPRMRITDRAGKDMERVPRAVDVPVKRPIGESYTGRDVQLDAAVQELLKDLGERGTR